MFVDQHQQMLPRSRIDGDLVELAGGGQVVVIKVPVDGGLGPAVNGFKKRLARFAVQAYRDAVKLLLCYVADTLGKSVDELFVEDISEPLVLAFLEQIE